MFTQPEPAAEAPATANVVENAIPAQAQPAPQPQMVEIDLYGDGRKFAVPPEVANKLQFEQQQARLYQGRYDTLRQQIPPEQYQQPIQSSQAMPTPVAQQQMVPAQDDFLSEARAIDEELGAEGKIAGLFEKLTQRIVTRNDLEQFTNPIMQNLTTQAKILETQLPAYRDQRDTQVIANLVQSSPIGSFLDANALLAETRRLQAEYVQAGNDPGVVYDQYSQNFIRAAADNLIASRLGSAPAQSATPTYQRTPPGPVTRMGQSPAASTHNPGGSGMAQQVDPNRLAEMMCGIR